MENVVGSAFDDVITGTGDANSLRGGGGNDKITGGAGNDSMDGGIGNDECDTGDVPGPTSCGTFGVPDINPRPNAAYAYVDNNPIDPGIFVIGSDPAPIGAAPGAQNDSLTITPAGAGYRVSGTPVASVDGTCVQENPNSVLCTAVGALGYVTMSGLAGNDTLKLTGSYPAFMTGDIDGGDGNDLLEGSNASENLGGGPSGADVMRGGAGEDSLFAEGTGGDVLDAGADNDQLVTDDPCQGHDFQGGQGFDIAGFGRYDLAFGGKNGVKAQLGGTATDPLRGNCRGTQIRADNEILEGSPGPDVLLGDNQNNPLILGREGDDEIRGGGGSDKLQGDGGNDSLFGEAGFDTLDAQDGGKDKVLNCGSGGGEVFRDGKDPGAAQCGKSKGKKKKKKK
jgi:Ca2+-binding RTX toxin-like protein